MKTIQAILDELKINQQNAGAFSDITGWSETTSYGEFQSINPTNGQPIASVYNASEKDLTDIIQQAHKKFHTWRMIPAPKRGELIREIGDALRKKKEALGRLVSLEAGKSLQEGLGEVQEMIDMADFATGQARQLYGFTMHSERPAHRMYEQWHPLGVTTVITAFNFPVAVFAWNAFIAAICGNTVIWKPSAKTPLCAIAVQHICNEVFARKKDPHLSGIFSLFITEDHQRAEKLVTDPTIALVSFTGSTHVGKSIHEKVAKRLGKSLLELGGNNAMIVDASANLKLAIPAIVFGAIGTAGQRCTTTRRLLIEESIYDVLIDALIKAYAQIKIGDPLDAANLMGPLIDGQAVAKFEAAIKTIEASGGKILFGGKKLNRAGFFVEPTLVACGNQLAIVQQETFSPILYVMKFRKLEDAIAMQNHSEYGLSSALFTENFKAAELFLSAKGSDCGIANINIGTSGAEIGGAFGGEKNTGGGREAGSDAWKAYMRRQTATLNWSDTLPLAQGIKFELAD